MSFTERVSRLIERHAPNVPEMAARLQRAGITVGDRLGAEQLARLPLLRKSALRELQAASPPWGGLLATGFHPEACFMSPGGIVEPLVPHMVERLARLLAQAGFGAEHIVLNGFSYHVTPAGLLFHHALVQAGCTVLPAGPQNTALQAEYAQALHANAFVGIASHLKILFDQQPALKIRLAMAGAEPHVEALRAELLAAHGVRSFDMYGFAEAGIIAVSCREAGNLHVDADALVEVVDPTDGTAQSSSAKGELVVSLDNFGFPLLRFATGDLVEVDAEACPCHRTGVLRVLGRTDQSARVRGMLLHPNQLRQFLERAGLEACSVVLSREAERDHIAVVVRPAAASSGSKTVGAVRPDVTAIKASFRETCRLGADRIEVDPDLAADSCSIDDRRQS